MYRII